MTIDGITCFPDTARVTTAIGGLRIAGRVGLVRPEEAREEGGGAGK